MRFVLDFFYRSLVYVINCFNDNLGWGESSIEPAEENFRNACCELPRLIKWGYVLNSVCIAHTFCQQILNQD